MTLLNRILDSKSISSTYLVMLLLVSVLAIETQANSCFEPDAEPFPIWGPSTFPGLLPIPLLQLFSHFSTYSFINRHGPSRLKTAILTGGFL